MKTFIILLSLSITVSLHAQNYRLFNGATAKVFTSYTSPQRAFSISFDSVTYENGDSVYYNFFALPLEPNFYSENCGFWAGNDCFRQNYPVWLGKKVVASNSNNYHFFNLLNDTLHFTFQPNSSDTNIFFKDETQQFAMVYTGADTLTILSHSDSVRYFKVLHTLSDGGVSNSELNNFEIVIGKSFGLVTFFQIDSFPQVLKPLYLIGDTSPQTGFTELTNEMVYQYNVGDVLEYEDYYSPSEPPNTLYQLLTVLDKVETTDSLKYIVKSESFYKDSLLLLTDTISWDYKKDGIIVQVPFERFDGASKNMYLAQYGNRNLWSFQHEYDNSFAYCEADNVWGFLDAFESSSYKDIIVERIGYLMREVHTNDGYNSYYYRHRLIYFKLSGEEWGDRIYLNIKENIDNSIAVKIFPNPASNYITVESDVPVKTIVLFHASGKRVLEVSARTTIQNIDLSAIKSGVYLMNISLENGSVITKKIVVSK